MPTRTLEPWRVVVPRITDQGDPELRIEGNPETHPHGICPLDYNGADDLQVAHLIATAPKLLAAAKFAVRAMCYRSGDERVAGIDLRAAIAEAERVPCKCCGVNRREPERTLCLACVDADCSPSVACRLPLDTKYEVRER